MWIFSELNRKPILYVEHYASAKCHLIWLRELVQNLILSNFEWTITQSKLNKRLFMRNSVGHIFSRNESLYFSWYTYLFLLWNLLRYTYVVGYKLDKISLEKSLCYHSLIKRNRNNLIEYLSTAKNKSVVILPYL